MWELGGKRCDQMMMRVHRWVLKRQKFSFFVNNFASLRYPQDFDEFSSLLCFAWALGLFPLRYLANEYSNHTLLGLGQNKSKIEMKEDEENGVKGAKGAKGAKGVNEVEEKGWSK
jgi:hypothetical protein